MKSIIREISKTLLYIYAVFCYYHTKVEDRLILIESTQGDDLDSNMLCLLKELQQNYRDYEVCLVVKGSTRTRIEALLKEYGVAGVKYLRRNSPQYCKGLSRAKYLFNDTSFSYLFIKKKEQVYLNIWHGTPLKKMGDDLAIGKLSQGNVKRNFMMSDFILFSNQEFEERMSAAYGLAELYSGKIINSGYPKNSLLLDRQKEADTRSRLGLLDKKVVVYMPTHRGVFGVEQYKSQTGDIEKMLAHLDLHLTDNEVVFVKSHSFVKEKIDISKYEKVRFFPDTLDSYELLNCADVLVTDYSSVMFDFLNTGKKIILYTYDYDDYSKQRGLYYDLDDLPFARVNTEDELLSEIRSSAEFDYSSVQSRFTTYDSPSATTDLLEFILQGNSAGLAVKEPERALKQNTLLYVGNLNLNGITSSVLNLLSVIDDSPEDLIYCVKQSHFEQQPEKILALPENARVVPIFDKLRPSFLEGLALVATYRFNIETKTTLRLLDRMFERESYRLFGDLRLDRVIQYTGYDVGVIGIFEKLNAKRAIFAHNDMIKEYQTRRNINLKMLRHFYNNFDRVACVSQAAYDSVVKIADRKDHIRMVQNAIDGETIRQKALLEPQFDEGTRSNRDLKSVVDILASDSITFINIARFSAEKGQRRLMDAFNEFHKSDPDSHLIIIGGLGELFENLATYAGSLEARKNITLIKGLTNPYPFLKRSNCFAFSSFYEGLGVVLLEAAVLDVPMFSTDIQGPREFLNSYNGALVEDSVSGILEGMRKYSKGEIGKLDFDYASYNEKVAQEFDSLFK